MAKVLLVTNVRSGGGTEKHVAAIAKALNLEVAYLEDGLWRLFRRLHEPFQLVHFFLPRSYVLGTILSALAGKHTRIVSRRALAYGHHPVMRILERLCHRHTDVLIGNSPAVCDELAKEAPKADIRLIRNGVDFKPLPHRNSGSYTIVCVANVWKHKHHDTLLKAFARALPHLPEPCRLVLVGRGTEQFNKHFRVYGYGYRKDIPEILSTADLFVMPSCAEGCPNALLEAMVAGVPVIAANVGGNQDAVVDGWSGALFPPKEAHNLSIAIRLAAARPQTSQLMAEQGQADIRERFSMEKCIKKYEALYNELVQAKQGQAVPSHTDGDEAKIAH